MAKILNIESSGDVCSVALADGGKVYSAKEAREANIHSEMLTVFIEELFEAAGEDISDIHAVAVSKGPGSYTGLRIGVSVAKGIAYALDIPLLAVATLKSMAYGMMQKIKEEGILTDDLLLCPMIDARRMEVYSEFYDINLQAVKNISADIIEADSYLNHLENHRLIFFGSGAEKCRKLIRHKHAEFRDDLLPSAYLTAPLAEEKFQNSDFEDTAYFEPFYLKNFIAKIPTKNVYG